MSPGAFFELKDHIGLFDDLDTRTFRASTNKIVEALFLLRELCYNIYLITERRKYIA